MNGLGSPDTAQRTDNAVFLEEVSVVLGEQRIHEGLNLPVRPGEIVTLLGPSGAGKTVLLKLIIGLLKPTTGSVWVLGEEIGAKSESELAGIRQRVSMLFQGAALFDSLSVFENIAYGLRERGLGDEAQLREIVEKQLSFVGLGHSAQKYPSQLSGGQKKRIGLARALATSPSIILYDEPTTGLDPTSTRRIDELILRLRNEHNLTSIIVTHDIASARRISDRWILLGNGTVFADGEPEELLRSNAALRRFAEGRWGESEEPE